MSRRTIDYETLTAYVDGELDAARAADVLAAAARDPAVARELSALGRLKATIACDAPPVDFEIEAPRRGRRMISAVAACLALFVAVAASLTIVFKNESHGLDTAWLHGVHDSWNLSAMPVAPTRISGHAAVKDPAAYVPDLTSAKLFIAHVSSVPGPTGGHATLIGYRGTRGCKVSLIVVADTDAFSDEMTSLDVSPHRGYAWRAGTRGYVVFAEGMAEDRFSLIARSVRDASLRHLPLDSGTQQALGESRAKSVPCLA